VACCRRACPRYLDALYNKHSAAAKSWFRGTRRAGGDMPAAERCAGLHAAFRCRSPRAGRRAVFLAGDVSLFLPACFVRDAGSAPRGWNMRRGNINTGTAPGVLFCCHGRTAAGIRCVIFIHQVAGRAGLRLARGAGAGGRLAATHCSLQCRGLGRNGFAVNAITTPLRKTPRRSFSIRHAMHRR